MRVEELLIGVPKVATDLEAQDGLRRALCDPRFSWCYEIPRPGPTSMSMAAGSPSPARPILPWRLRS
jgi:hypothetical protein